MYVDTTNFGHENTYFITLGFIQTYQKNIIPRSLMYFFLVFMCNSMLI